MTVCMPLKRVSIWQTRPKHLVGWQDGIDDEEHRGKGKLVFFAVVCYLDDQIWPPILEMIAESSLLTMRVNV